MNTIKHPELVEDKCQRLLNQTFDQYFYQCMDEGLRMEDMYSKLGATKSNFRGLMQKYNLSIRLPDSEPMFSEVKKFREEEINDANALYRKWGNIISY